MNISILKIMNIYIRTQRFVDVCFGVKDTLRHVNAKWTSDRLDENILGI